MSRRLFPIAVLVLASCSPGPVGGGNATNETGVNETDAPAFVPQDVRARPAPVDDDPARLISSYLERLEVDDYAAAHKMFPSGGEPDIFDADGPVEIEEYEVGEATIEGACGSTYATVPVRVEFSRTMTGENVSLSGTISLRRVNDVPGSSDEERRWRFASADLTRS